MNTLTNEALEDLIQEVQNSEGQDIELNEQCALALGWLQRDTYWFTPQVVAKAKRQKKSLNIMGGFWDAPDLTDDLTTVAQNISDGWVVDTVMFNHKTKLWACCLYNESQSLIVCADGPSEVRARLAATLKTLI